jgi:dolichyl-diphosphooligosaccharide--protein glycosyltransferase
VTCLGDSFGFVPVASFVLLVVLCIFALWKRRRSDILLALWSVVIFNATITQIRFSYYLAVNMALLIGWAAARVAEMTGLARVEVESRTPEDAKKATKGRKTQRAKTPGPGMSRPMQIACVAAVLLLVFPGNVVASQRTAPGWAQANIDTPDGDLVLWFRGLNWMRENTPDAGVDLGLVVAKPPEGTLYDYPATTYGVLSWWDYGHWIETTALRPPVANPFQQAAPFASAWFTERDPVIAEKKLDDWAQGKGPIRYVWIDDEMATGKFGAITVWAHNANSSRDQWTEGEYLTHKDYREDTTGQSRSLFTPGPEYTESMMGRLYDRDGDGLGHYRLVWEDPSYEVIGSFTDADGNIRNACFHEAVPSRSCPIGLDLATAATYQPGTLKTFASDAKGYDIIIASRLKLFERVPGAHLIGSAPPGATVSAAVNVNVANEGVTRPFRHAETAIADAAGKFDIVFPYSTVGAVPPSQGGTNVLVKPTSQVLVDNGQETVLMDVPDGAVLHGDVVPVTFG